jgi:ABC-type Mn2+/Zn2+ transport system ATPase subunit
VSGAALAARDLSFAYGGGQRALEDVTFEVPRGSMVGIIGPNGGGKSTLIKVLLGLVEPQRGAVEVLGQPVKRRLRRLLGYVPQQDDVDLSFPVSVLDVVLMGRVPSLKLFRRFTGRDLELAREALEIVGMEEHAGAPIGELSGGQQQRVFLARALAQEAEVLLLDEPVSGVDAPSQHEVFGLLRRLQERGKTVLLTSHGLSAIGERFDLALLLNRRVVAFGAPEEVFTRELLDEAYGGRLKVLKIGDDMVAMEEDHG